MRSVQREAAGKESKTEEPTTQPAGGSVGMVKKGRRRPANGFVAGDNAMSRAAGSGRRTSVQHGRYSVQGRRQDTPVRRTTTSRFTTGHKPAPTAPTREQWGCTAVRQQGGLRQALLRGETIPDDGLASVPMKATSSIEKLSSAAKPVRSSAGW